MEIHEAFEMDFKVSYYNNVNIVWQYYLVVNRVDLIQTASVIMTSTSYLVM